jgi:hypothetical protein
MPKLPVKHTCLEEVVDCLLLLITKRAIFGVRQTSASKSVCCPIAVVSDQPQEKFAFPRSPSPPDQFASREIYGSIKKGLIG